MAERPLLMIPGPVEISPEVQRAFSVPPPGHLAAHVIEATGASIERMRRVWKADAQAQPFIVAGSGTLAMDMAVCNVLDPGDEAVVVDTGYFSHRMQEILRRRGVAVSVVPSAPGAAPPLEEVEAALEGSGTKVLFATHVDTSTAVRVDPAPLAALARSRGVLSVFDGVCATAAEPFEMEEWGADVYLTGSQKAIGLPVGLALMVASARAMEARASVKTPMPMFLDWQEWLPIMTAYEERRASYFATPATNLLIALNTGLDEILNDELGGLRGVDARVERHARTGKAMRAAWLYMGLDLVPVDECLCANTLSAIRYPEGVDPALVGLIRERGVIVAGGLHPDLKTRYFRVGHMGHVTTQPSALFRTVRAVSEALGASGVGVDTEGAISAAREVLGGERE